jgi:hypothetical protein
MKNEERKALSFILHFSFFILHSSFPVYFARLRYEPSRVSTWMTSPVLINDGTVIFRPVSRVAGFYCAAAVAPFTEGSVSMTFSSMVLGNSRLNGLSAWNVTLASSFSLR